MKKVISLLLALTMVMGLVVSASAYAETSLEAPKAGDVVIDGDLSEWNTEKCLRIDTDSQIIDQIEHWDGVEDCSMELYAMWDEENLYVAMQILDDTPLVYREGFPLDELDAVILFLSTDPEADPDRTEYTATDWRIVQSAENYSDEYYFYNYIDRDMLADNMGWETQGEYGDEQVFDDYEAAVVKIDGGIVWESKIPLHNLSNDNIAQLTPEAGMTVGFDFSVLDVDLPCPGIHSLRMESSANLDGKDRTPEVYDVDNDPSHWGTLTFVEE